MTAIEPGCYVTATFIVEDRGEYNGHPAWKLRPLDPDTGKPFAAPLDFWPGHHMNVVVFMPIGSVRLVEPEPAP